MSNRIARNIYATMLVGSTLFAAGGASAAQLTLNWVDNAGGTAYFTIERKTETTGTYAPIATTGTGTTTFADPTVVASTTYCYRVKASNVFGDSGYSNEACGSVAAGLDFTVAKAGTGSGTVVSNPSGINCGGDCVASFAAGTVITLTAIPSPGSTFGGWSGAGCSGPDPCTLVGNVPVTVTATFTESSTEATPPTLTLVYNGMLRDRVGQDNTALTPDGALDGTLTATLSAAGGRTVTGLRLDSNAPGTWDTTSATDYWALGVAATLDGALLNAAGTMAVTFAVADGGSFVLFASDSLGTEFLVGNTLTLTVTFADGSTATATTTVANASPATLTLVHNGKLRDRVGQDNTALAPDGALDGTLTATLSAAGGRTITGLRLDSNAVGTWDADSATPYWVLAVTTTLDGPVLNAPGTMAVNFAVADGGSFVLFASDYLGTEFLSGNTLTLTATFADGSMATAVTTVP